MLAQRETFASWEDPEMSPHSYNNLSFVSKAVKYTNVRCSFLGK